MAIFRQAHSTSGSAQKRSDSTRSLTRVALDRRKFQAIESGAGISAERKARGGRIVALRNRRATTRSVARTSQIRSSETCGGLVGLAVFAALSFPTTINAKPEPIKTLDARIRTLAKTQDIIQTKHGERRSALRKHVREAYKIFREGEARVWERDRLRINRSRKEQFLRELILRDLHELDALAKELEHVKHSSQIYTASRVSIARKPPMQPKSLVAPTTGTLLEGFGRYRDAKTGAWLVRHGITLQTQPKGYVRAVADGQIRYAGQMHNLGQAVVTHHEGYYSILGNLNALQVEAGKRVRAGQTIASSSSRTYIEIRLDVGPGGLPINPTPLLILNR